MNNLSALNSKPITHCQFCESKRLESIVFLGYVPPVNEMLKVQSVPDVEMRFPLELLRCHDCQLVQIGYEVDLRILFPYTYPYLSGTTRILRDNFKDLADEACRLFNLSSSDLIIDVGANDGTLLIPFKAAGYQVLGIEPSQAADVAVKSGIPMVKGYFNSECSKTIRSQDKCAKIVTAANVFAHIKNVHDVVESVKEILLPDGVFISESHYLLDLVQTLQYDTVYHEHLRYYSVSSLAYLFNQHDMEIIRVKRIPTHGGSIRVYAARKGKFPVDSSVTECLAIENASGLTDGTIFASFRQRIIQSKLELLRLIADIKSEGKRIYGIGAPSRSSTLINYVGLDDGLLDCVMEVSSSHKLDKYIPGTRIPVLDENKLYIDQPEYALLNSWHIGAELAMHLKNKGFKGDFISPLPTPEIFNPEPALTV
jgi:SAM-dependent methyltransferase